MFKYCLFWVFKSLIVCLRVILVSWIVIFFYERFLWNFVFFKWIMVCIINIIFYILYINVVEYKLFIINYFVLKIGK